MTNDNDRDHDLTVDFAEEFERSQRFFEFTSEIVNEYETTACINDWEPTTEVSEAIELIHRDLRTIWQKYYAEEYIFPTDFICEVFAKFSNTLIEEWNQTCEQAGRPGRKMRAEACGRFETDKEAMAKATLERLEPMEQLDCSMHHRSLV